MEERGGTLPEYLGKRILQVIPLVVAVVVVNFLLVHLAPGDPINALVGDFPAPEAYIQQVRKDFGLDQPLWRQLWLYFTQLSRGNLGYSFANRQPVLQLIYERLWATLSLGLTALFFAALVGVALGIFSAQRPYSWLDNFTSFLSLVGFSMPVFWLGQILIIGVALNLGVLPAQGIRSLRADPEGWGAFIDFVRHLILPAFCLSLRFIALNARIARSSMMQVLKMEYIITARSKGLPETRVIYQHALRNAMIPIVTVVGYNFGFLFAGSILVETVFAWPGIGRLLYDSVFSRDYPVLMGIFLFICTGIIIVNLLTDLTYAFLDPRIRR
jgi:peptide/nickel transport system permease protein